MGVDKLWEARVSDYTDDVLVGSHRQVSIIASRLKLAFVAKYLRVLMIENAVATLEQLRLSQISSGTAPPAPLHEFGSILPAAQFCFSAALAILIVRTLYYFSAAVENGADVPGGFTRRHRFCTAA